VRKKLQQNYVGSSKVTVGNVVVSALYYTANVLSSLDHFSLGFIVYRILYKIML